MNERWTWSVPSSRSVLDHLSILIGGGLWSFDLVLISVGLGPAPNLLQSEDYTLWFLV